MGEFVTLYEMAPRDGLQNEPRPIPTRGKVQLTNLLSATGLRKIEVTSFVSARWVPQMGDAEAVMAQIKRKSGVTYGALTPNMHGLERAIASGVREVAVFASASEGFSKANINATRAQSLTRLRRVIAGALAEGLTVRGYVSCVTDCPYDGPTPPRAVAEMTEALLAEGCYEVSLGDTIGKGTPETVGAMLAAVLKVARPDQLAGHYHDTAGRALENIRVSLDHGLRTFDSSVGGIGGCPYAKGATGNVATEAVVEMLEGMGFETGVDRKALAAAIAFAQEVREAADEIHFP